MNENLRHGFRLGRFEVLPGQNLITGPRGTARVEPKSMAVLARLVVAGGDTVSRLELIDAAWPGRVVTDDVLSRCITQLRKAFGDNARAPQYLETIPKQGYRLMKPVTLPAPLSRVGEDALGIIVLPFQNNSGRADDAYIADGFTELLIARLATLDNTRVISRTTAMSFAGTRKSAPEIAARVGVDWVVEGSILASQDNIQVVAQLIDARSDAHVWAESYFRAITDLLVLQNDMASQVAGRIGRELGVGNHGVGAGAQGLSAETLRIYLQGRQLVSRRNTANLRKATDCFEKLTKLEPAFAEGWACRAEALILLMHYGAESPQGGVTRAFALVNRALEIDPECAIALSARGSLRLFFDRDFERGTADLKRALHSQPDYIFALLSLANAGTICGEFAEALRWLQQAIDVDPLDVGTNMNLGDHLILHRRYGEAVEQLHRTLDLAADHAPSRLRLAWALALDGNEDDAMRELETVKQDNGNSAAWTEYATIVSGAAEDREQAQVYLEQLQQLAADCTFVSPWALARAAASAGRYDQALEQLERACRAGSSSLPFYGVTPVFDGLRETVAGQAMLESLGVRAVS